MAVLLVLAGTVATLVALLVVGRARTGGALLATLRRGPELPEPRPERSPGRDLRGVDPHGRPLVVPVTGRGAPIVLAFLGSTCVTCRDLWRDADRAQRRTRGGLRLVLVTPGPEADSAERIAALRPRTLPVVMSSDAWPTFGVRTAPSFVLIHGGDGRASPLPPGPTWTRVLRAARDVLGADDAR